MSGLAVVVYVGVALVSWPLIARAIYRTQGCDDPEDAALVLAFTSIFAVIWPLTLVGIFLVRWIMRPATNKRGGYPGSAGPVPPRPTSAGAGFNKRVPQEGEARA